MTLPRLEGDLYQSPHRIHTNLDSRIPNQGDGPTKKQVPNCPRTWSQTNQTKPETYQRHLHTHCSELNPTRAQKHKGLTWSQPYAILLARVHIALESSTTLPWSGPSRIRNPTRGCFVYGCFCQQKHRHKNGDPKTSQENTKAGWSLMETTKNHETHQKQNDPAPT